jgi:hypothetical protein
VRGVAVWESAERLLKQYSTKWCIAGSLGFGEAPGLYLTLVSLVFLIGVPCAVSAVPSWPRTLIGVAAILYILDSVLVNTSVAFVSRRPENRLRSVVLTMFAFFNLIVAFSALYAWLGDHFLPGVGSLEAAFFLSVTTAATIGGAEKPIAGTGKLLMSFQLGTTLYFLTVIVATIINLDLKNEKE